MASDYRKSFAVFAVVAMFAGAAMPAHAHDDEEHFSVALNPTWKSECGSCHVAFPPRLLPAESWRAVMSGLDKHFGSDASLEAPEAREIGAFLETNAGKRKRESIATPVLRITETRWFLREHDEVAPEVWKNPRVKSPSNCAACHTLAESGDYRERNIRVPE